MTPRPPSVGTARPRVDGPLKVAGLAPYAYEQPVEHPAYLHPIAATIPLGRITAIDTAAAEALDGVLLILTHRNAPRLYVGTDASLRVLQSPDVHHRGQLIGAVVARTPEIAREAASLVQVTYDARPHDLTFRPDHPQRYAPKRVGFRPADTHHGDVDAAMNRAAHTIDQTYTTPAEHHTPMEPHPVTAIWHGAAALNPRARRLTLYDSNQGPLTVSLFLAPLLGLLPTQVEVTSPYVGGSFGTKGMPHPHLVLVSLAARLLPGQPVKYAMSRRQTFYTTGHRPPSRQRVRLAADASGRLSAVAHDSDLQTARVKEYGEHVGAPARVMYAAPNRRYTHRLTPLDGPPAMFMRAPGEFSGMFALETAMDELAHACGLDPIELRVRNEPDVDPDDGKPFSSRHFLDCLRQGAAHFGWADRHPTPRTRLNGEWAWGVGVAGATYPHVHLLPSRARIHHQGGRYRVSLQAADLGTGASTVLAQIAADALGISADDVDVELGRSGLPLAISAGGSMGTHSWGGAVMVAAVKFRESHGPNPRDGASVSASGVMPRGYREYSRHAFGAHFAEVRVSTVTGEVRVERLLGVYAAGRIINPRTATSQFIGGMTMGLSAALHEETITDPRSGLIVNADLAGYHIASHADVPDVQALWIEERDPFVGPTGAKGIGELCIVGVPAAIGNAIHNATGTRLRDLPFTPDKLLPG